MELGIKNDEALVKIATILQRIFQSESGSGDDFAISEEEKAQDLKQAESILDALKQNEKIMQKQQIARAKSRKLAKDW